MDISAGVIVREGQLVRKGPDLVSVVSIDSVTQFNIAPKI